MIDLNKQPKAIEIINNVLNNGGICEIKCEGKKTGTPIVTIVEIGRTVKLKQEIEI